MKKLVLGMTFFILIFTVVCGADEIRGKVTSPGGDGKTLLISGVTIQAAEAWVEDIQDYPLALKTIAKGQPARERFSTSPAMLQWSSFSLMKSSSIW